MSRTAGATRNAVPIAIRPSEVWIITITAIDFRFARYDLRGHLKDNSIRGSIKMIENLKSKKKSKGKGDTNDWTWSEFANLVKYSKVRRL